VNRNAEAVTLATFDTASAGGIWLAVRRDMVTTGAQIGNLSEIALHYALRSGDKGSKVGSNPKI
jgi:hypothetical protein